MWASNVGLPISVFSGFICAAVVPFLAHVVRHFLGRLIAVLPLCLSLYFALRIPELAVQSPIRFEHPWSDMLGVSLSFSLDGLSMLFALLISGIGTLIMIYAGDYLYGHGDIGRFYTLLLVFMASMLGVVLSDNLLVLFVFWELTSLSSFLLIGFEHEEEKARKSALQALLVTSTGGLAMLAGFLLVGQETGTYEISRLVEKGKVLRESSIYLPALILILGGAFTKSAQFPFHFWLPNAMSAPTPVSAYLHSATMVKAGIYLLARLSLALGGTAAWQYLVTSGGAITMMVGSCLALGQTDLKLLLAYMTMMALGALTMLLGVGSGAAIQAAVVFLIVHSLYKGALFLVAGMVDHCAGTRDVLRLGALGKTMPFLTTAALVSSLSMAGFPPLLGFVGKELVYKAALEVGGISTQLLILIAVFSKAAATLVASIICIRPFFRKADSTWESESGSDQEPPFGMLLGPFVLGALSVVFGIWPGILGESLIGPAISAIGGGDSDLELHAWPQLNIATLLSGVSVSMGVLGYFHWDRFRDRVRIFNSDLGKWGAAAAYERGLVKMQNLAKWQTRILQGGKMGDYLAIVFLVVSVEALISLTRLPWARLIPAWTSAFYYEWIIVGSLMVGSFAAIFARSMLSAFVTLGIIGYSIALIYVLYGAPDLAITQVFVETLTIVIATLIIGRIPEFRFRDKPPGARLRHALVAGVFGASMGGLLCLVLSGAFDPYVGEYFARNSAPEAFGRNIVNVILVDFRALDTLGEITVIAIAALGVFALLKAGDSGKARR